MLRRGFDIVTDGAELCNYPETKHATFYEVKSAESAVSVRHPS